MEKNYLGVNVYDALQKRFDYIFQEFENVYVSFSGGKDSGLLLNLILDYVKKHNIKKKIGVFHQDFEAQYELTTEYVEQTFEEMQPYIEPYWICLPVATRTALSSYEMFWYPWDDSKRECWVREMPDKPYVIHMRNNPIYCYRYKMHQEDLSKQFGRWYKETHGNARTICLLGIRASESLQRYSGIVNKKYGYNGCCWISRQMKDVWCGSPLYDWSVNDVWAANYKFEYTYNRIYDLYYKAGLKPTQMRVASPFNDFAKESLNLYRVLDPQMWTKLVGRVKGANFTAIYGKTKAMGYRSVTLPEGYTWEAYTKFLLDTLPKRLRKNYVQKFMTSIEFWHRNGGGLAEEVIAEIEACGYKIRRNGISSYTKDRKFKIVFLEKIPDHTDDVKLTKDIPSWKRMCYCILKNDHICRFMGFSLTRDQQKRIDAIRKKYKSLEELA